MRHVTASQRTLDDDRLRSTRGDLGRQSAEDRPNDDPAADEILENDPPIERSDGQVYGG